MCQPRLSTPSRGGGFSLTGEAIVCRRETCRLCGSPHVPEVLVLADTPAGDSLVTPGAAAPARPVFPLRLCLCKQCGNVQTSHVVAPEVLYRNYVYRTSVTLGLVEHFGRYAADVIARRGIPAGALVVDIGSNDGTLLRSFEKLGMRALGVEPATNIAAISRAAGIETVNEFFTASLGRKLKAERGPAQIVTANNVMANVDDLSDFMQGVRELLAPDGVFVAETGYVLDLLEKGLFDNIYHEHLSYFGVRPLEQFFVREGMELIDVTRMPNKGGTIIVTAQRAGGPRRPSPAIAELRGLERAKQAGEEAPFRDLARRLTSAKVALGDLVAQAQSAGKRVAGYGASVGAVTFIYHFDLGRNLVYVVDDDPDKQGKLPPGHRVPIVTPSRLDEDPADYLIILAWRYAKPIMEKRQRYAARGGKFVIPWPELQVL